ncbi:P-loop containing nucleoside triphosphate hydrolase protein [Mycena leptocephala]|nr:P-loop containing nucleoside triphosphate hydrolase protein [Mycena leptocephala]
MRVVKYFCYEGSFLARLFRIRTQELRGIRRIQHSQSTKCGAPFAVDMEQEAVVWAKGVGWVWEAGPPFALHDITLSIPRGTLAAVVGRVGSGRSSLLQGEGLIGMCSTDTGMGGGKWAFGGSVAYCGQKHRVNIARALYHGADVVIFDDPLSAVDANVGKALFHSAIQALHFLAQCGCMYTLDSGRIAEAGTYPELIARGGEFARLVREFGGAKAEDAGGEGAGEDGDEDEARVQVVSVEGAKARSRGAAGTGKIEGKLIVKERRTTGGVARSVYGYYAKAGGGWLTVPLIALVAVLMRGSQVANSYVLVWWQGNTFNKPFSFYQILYELLGISQATFTYLLGLFMDFFAVRVSENLHHQAIVNIFHAPMSFFDTTAMGRIISIFGNDIDTIDNALPMSMRMFILVLAQVLSSVIVITVLEHYFIVAVVLNIFGFSYFLQLYRASMLEMKRLDSMLRSILYYQRLPIRPN